MYSVELPDSNTSFLLLHVGVDVGNDSSWGIYFRHVQLTGSKYWQYARKILIGVNNFRAYLCLFTDFYGIMAVVRIKELLLSGEKADLAVH